AREGPGNRRRRGRLRGQALPDGGSARAAACADPSRERTGHTRAAVRRPRGRSADRPGDDGRKPREAHEPRVPRAVVPDAPEGTCRFAERADGAHLRAGLRSGLQHGGGLHRAPAAEARARLHRDGARPRLSRGTGAVTPRVSLRSRLLLGAVLWTIGLFTVTGIALTQVMLHHPTAPRAVHRT